MIRRTPLRKMSAKRQRESRIYAVKRKAFLEATPMCQLCTLAESQDVHHLEGRLGGNYLNEATWLPVCRHCHDWIHTHPIQAREQGLLK